MPLAQLLIIIALIGYVVAAVTRYRAKVDMTALGLALVCFCILFATGNL